MKKRILVSGGTGFIGYHLCKTLVRNNYLVDSLSSKKPKKEKKIKNVNYLICDLTNKKKLRRVINKNYEFVINLAGYVNHYEKTKTYNTHYFGCLNLIKCLKVKNLKLFIQIGSGLEYGLSKTPHSENLNGKPNSIYAKAKFNASKSVLNFTKSKSFVAIVLRIYQVYGPGQECNRLIPQVIKACLKNKKFNCTNGIQAKDFLYIEDLIKLFLLILKNKKNITNIFNVGYGKPTYIKKIIKKISLMIKGGEPIFGAIEMRKDEPISMYPNIKKISKFYKWRPKIRLNTGLSRTIKFFKKNDA